MANTDELRYIQAFSRIIGVKEDDAMEYAQKKGLNALVDNATQLLTTPVQREKHQAFLDLYRMSSGINTRNPIINSPEAASDFFHTVMDKIYDKEAFVVAFLNTKNRVIDHEVVSVGTINSSIVHPREVFRNAIINKANSVILCHNHPSGDLTPSTEDINITERLKETGNILGIKVLDHLIINGININEIYSFKTHGVLETTKTYNAAKSVLNEETDYNFTEVTNKQGVSFNVPIQEHAYPLPDPNISITDRNSYGYLDDEMLRQVQLDNKLFADNELENNNFTIEMETGTGKTYVYLRSILELFKEYDFKKFMIVVPSIAIRKGVEKSIDQLKDHFKRLYDVDLSKHSFIYDSNNPKMVSSSLVETNDLSICVLNIQAFNKDNNKIRSEDEYGQILWEDIKYIKPIVIIDEPQKIEGQKGKKSKSLQAIDDIEPLFVLRYSATHKQLYNQIYKLDSYAAYKNDLVKKITVKTVNGVIERDYPYIRYVAFTKDLKARIEMFSQKQGDSIRFKTFDVSANTSLEELSGGLVQYRNMRIAEEPHKLKPLKIATTDGTITLALGESNNGLEDSEATRIQIRLAIRNHFEKQFSILKSGRKIKTLTLFFVDAVSKVRDNTRPDGRGEYLRIFDEEYQSAIKGYEKQLAKYTEYFPEHQDILKVREGYFAIDKKNNEVEIEDWDDSKSELDVKVKSQEDIDRGISLILERKDELISFEEPLGFIFSHSALREGWDNPNVFTLCTLKNGSSDIAKKQEIGRGLRLPVDITGNRCLDAEVNELTVIANDSYENFSRVLQEDFNQNMNFNKNEVTAEILTVTLEKAGVPKEKITAELVDTFKQELMRKGIFDSNNILGKNMEQTSKLLEGLVFENEILNEHALMLKENFAEYMVQKGSQRIEIKNGDNEPYVNTIRAFVSQEEFQQIYFGLSSNLTKRTLYKCNVDKDKFISGCIEEINAYLQYFKVTKAVNIATGKAGFNDAQMFEMEKSGDKTFDIDVGMKVTPKSDFEVVNYIMHHTMLPRLAIFKVLAEIEKRDALNFQDILDRVTQKILVRLNDAKAANISSYEVIDGYELDEGQIFATDTISEEDFNDEWRIFKSNPNRKNALNEYYKMDSKGEKEFAEKLEANDNVILFTKLKKGGFVIDTPYGHYSPDWAVVCRKDGLETGAVGIYFIVETKAGKLEKDLTDVEANKIRCGELHFKAVSELVKFNWVNSYEDFKTKFGVKESM